MDRNLLGIIQSIKGLVQLDPDEHLALVDRVTVREIPKSDVFLKAGEICKKLSFLEKGSMSYIRYASSGDRHVVNLSIQGDWVLDQESLTKQSPANLTIIAHSDCLVSSISIESLHELIDISNKYFVLGRLFAVSELQSFLNRQDTSPDDRYLFLLEHRAELLQAFPLKDIASFLRMTPETLSRIRRRIRET